MVANVAHYTGFDLETLRWGVSLRELMYFQAAAHMYEGGTAMLMEASPTQRRLMDALTRAK